MGNQIGFKVLNYTKYIFIFGSFSLQFPLYSNARFVNLAKLVKYWGKRPDDGADLNLPAVGSLSMTLSTYRTVTEVRRADVDALTLDGMQLKGAPAARVARRAQHARLGAEAARKTSWPHTPSSSCSREKTRPGLCIRYSSSLNSVGPRYGLGC